jgi:hypothetical protein
MTRSTLRSRSALAVGLRFRFADRTGCEADAPMRHGAGHAIRRAAGLIGIGADIARATGGPA